MQFIKTGFRISYKTGIWLTIISFVFSRFTGWYFGIRFSADATINGAWQLADPVLLKTKLLQTLWYLHTQPPLFNLFVGTGLKLFPINYSMYFGIIYCLTGICIVILMFILMQKLRIAPWIAAIFCIGWNISPVSILFESWLFYEYPVVLLLMLAAISIFQFVDTGRAFYAGIFFFSMAIIVLMRSMFHPIFIVFIISMLLYVLPVYRKKLLRSSLIPLVLIVGWPTKNLLVTGNFTYSTWYGMNLFKVVGRFLPEQTRLELVTKGKLPKACVHMSFSKSVNDYAAIMPLAPNPYPKISFLADSMKQNQEVNFHNYQFIEISEQYKLAAAYIVKNYPQYYFKSLIGATLIYFETPSRYFFLDENRLKIGTYESLWYWYVINYKGEKHKHYINPVALGLFIAVAFWLFLRINVILKRLMQGISFSAQEITMGFVLICTTYVTAIGIMAEFGENMRFRFQILPFSLLILAYIVNWEYKARTTNKHE